MTRVSDLRSTPASTETRTPGSSAGSAPASADAPRSSPVRTSQQFRSYAGQSGFTAATQRTSPLDLKSGRGATVDPGKVGVVLNDDPTRLPSGEELKRLGVTGARVTLSTNNFRPDNEGVWQAKLDDYKNNNIEVVINLPSELAEGFPRLPSGWTKDQPPPEGWDQQFDAWKNEKWIPRFQQVINVVGDRASGFEIWNEPDEPANRDDYSPAITPESFGRLMQEAYFTIKGVESTANAKVITGGLDSGQADYLTRAAAATGGQLYADGVGLHPYNKTTSTDPTDDMSLAHIVNDYSGFTGPSGDPMKLYITEASQPDRNQPGWDAEFARSADGMDAVRKSYFFWQETWDGHPGLAVRGDDGQWNPTQFYNELAKALGTA